LTVTRFEEDFGDGSVTFNGGPHQRRHIVNVSPFNVGAARNLQQQQTDELQFTVKPAAEELNKNNRNNKTTQSDQANAGKRKTHINTGKDVVNSCSVTSFKTNICR